MAPAAGQLRNVVVLAIAAVGLLIAAPVHGATFSVDTGVDGADVLPGDGTCDATAGVAVLCTLRAAVQEANATPEADTIDLPGRAAPYLLTLEGAGPAAGGLDLTGEISIVGAGAGRTKILALWEDEFGGRLVDVAPGVTATLAHLTLMGGEACGNGGAILNLGSLRLDSVTLRDNLAELGGAVANGGSLTIVNSSLVRNRSVLIADDPDAESCIGSDRAGGGAVYSTGTLEVANTTLSSNNASAAGGALLNDAGAIATLNHVTVAGNGTAAALAGSGSTTLGASIVSGALACSPDVLLLSLGANIISDASCGPGLGAVGDLAPADAMLAPLMWTGGAAFHEPATTSPAVDHAGACTLERDQLGRPRPQGAACDAGAVEGAPPVGDDSVRWRRFACTIVGTAGDDVLRGTPGRDVICGLDGNDVLIGLAGNDLLVGGRGSDDLRGGSGRDGLYGERGHDRLRGGRGRDGVYGDKGRDKLHGGRGPDRLMGGKGRDFLNGGLGPDVLRGGPGRDRARFDRSVDRLHGIEPWRSRKVDR